MPSFTDLLVRPALLGVRLQPLLGRAVAAVAVHAFGDVELRPAQLRLDVDRVAHEALAARLRLGDLEIRGDLRRAHAGLQLLVGERGVGLGVLVLLEPDDVLVQLGKVRLGLGVAVAAWTRRTTPRPCTCTRPPGRGRRPVPVASSGGSRRTMTAAAIDEGHDSAPCNPMRHGDPPVLTRPPGHRPTAVGGSAAPPGGSVAGSSSFFGAVGARGAPGGSSLTV